MTGSDARTALVQAAGSARMARIPNWSATVAILIGSQPWATCEASAEGIVVAEGATASTVDTTVVVRDEDTLGSWLLDGLDYTHLVRSGEMTVHGSSFDVLLLSKALGLRPEKVSR